MTPAEDREYDEQLDVFIRLRDRIDAFLEQHERPDTLLAPGDYSAHDDFRGTPQVKVSVGNLELLRARIVYQLQQIVVAFPGWEIVYAVALDDHLDDWPNMGLYIRPHDIIDGLQRQYFPKEYRDIEYVGARRGTEKD
jgi:hypothetical protein